MRLTRRDDWCAYCDFEGRRSATFAYVTQKGEVIHWCSWHQAYVPDSSAKGNERIPPSAAPFEAPQLRAAKSDMRSSKR